MCRQIDDYAVASTNVKAGEKFIKCINDEVTTMILSMGSETPLGLFAWYNGLDIHQFSTCVRLSCTTYIKRMLETHGWDKPSPNETDCHDTTPMSKCLNDKLYLSEGPAKHTPKH